MTRDDRPLGTRVADLEARVMALEARRRDEDPTSRPALSALPNGNPFACATCSRPFGGGNGISGCATNPHGPGYVHFPACPSPSQP